MDPDLVIDDDYVKSVGKSCGNRGGSLDKILKSYLDILKDIRKCAVLQGETANALDAYIGCVLQLTGQLKTISENVFSASNSFIVEVDRADDFLF